MIGFNGGLIGKFRDTATGTTSVPGVWTANEQVVAQRRRMWGSLDLFFSSVSLLLPGDGTNGSTSIIDCSPSPKTITAFGNAQISTAQNRFGGSSIAFDGNGDYLSVPNSSDFNFPGQFTIEFHLFLNNLSNRYDPIGNYEGASSGWGVAVTTGGAVNFYFGNTGVTQTAGSLITANAWNHIAITRTSDNTVRIFIGGTERALNVNSANFAAFSQPLFIGATGSATLNLSSLHVNGYIDDLRITKGVARYTANFTPPTAPHPF